MSSVAISVKNVHKSFRLPNEKNNSLKSAIVNFRQHKKGYTEQKVLRGVSFDIQRGDFFGIVGRNGSGKSTLLKIISEIYSPEKGSVTVNGSLTPFIELGVGFNPELTGRENVYMNGALLGFSHTEIDEVYKDIVEFAELEKFMDQKLKNYSSGMQVRLAFSVAIQAKSDILVLDEVLAVGDEAFQRKCDNFFNAIKKDKSKTVVLVTHSMDAVRRFCNKAVLITEGKIVKSGSPDKVASAYSDIFIQEARQQNEKQDSPKNTYNWPISVEEMNIVQNKKPTKTVVFREDFTISIDIKSPQSYNEVICAIDIVDAAGRVILNTSTRELKEKMKLAKGTASVSIDIENIFAEGEYYINYAMKDDFTEEQLFKYPEIYQFNIIGNQVRSKSSLTHPDVTWSVK